jgi:uroporphyrinogen-III synthase
VQQLFAHVRDARELAGATVAAIGPGTVAELRRHGIAADVVPERSISEAVLEELTARGPWSRVLIPRAEEARDVLPDGLRALGAHVDVLALYRTVAEELGPEAARPRSARTTRCSPAPRAPGTSTTRRARSTGPRIVSIGPVTSDAIRALGRRVDVEAAEHSRTASSPPSWTTPRAPSRPGRPARHPVCRGGVQPASGGRRR